ALLCPAVQECQGSPPNKSQPRSTGGERMGIRIAGVLGAAALLCAALLGTGTAQADSGQIETSYQNPVTALPPVSKPDTHHCTVTAMQYDFGNTISSPAWNGTVTPPADCPGPWNKVVLNWSGSVQGRQYDRLAGVWIGGAEVLRTS